MILPSYIRNKSKNTQKNSTTLNSIELKRGATTLYIYDKHSEMSSKPDYYPAEDIEKSLGVLRVELRFERRKLRYEQKKRKLDTAIDFLNESKKIAPYLFRYYLKLLFFESDYHSLAKANEIIDTGSHNPMTNMYMALLLGNISIRHSMVAGITEMIRHNKKYGKPHNIRYLLESLSDLNINPVTIPSRANIDYLPNLLHYFTNDNIN